MWILDRERYWAFAKAYFICFTALVGLYVVIDAFSNLDEFAKRADGIKELVPVMGRYYLVHMSEFYDRLCGVISMMAAIFTVTWMQRNNELLAMLAAGISTQRVIRPVIVSALVVSGFAVANQEWVMPGLAEELQKTHDDDGTRKVQVFGRLDGNGIFIHGDSGDRNSRTVYSFGVTFPEEIFGKGRDLSAEQACYIPANHPTAPQTGGWLLRGVPIDEPFVTNQTILVKITDEKGFPPPVTSVRNLGRETYFLHTGITFPTLTRNRQWYQYAPTVDLVRGLADPANEPEKNDIAVFLHGRLLRPLLALALLGVTLPLVLGGYGRNMFVNLGYSLATSAVFYATVFVCQYLGAQSVIPAELSAWGPLIGFGTFAVARWGAIRS